jgi:hypothetical protein
MQKRILGRGSVSAAFWDKTIPGRNTRRNTPEKKREVAILFPREKRPCLEIVVFMDSSWK